MYPTFPLKKYLQTQTFTHKLVPNRTLRLYGLFEWTLKVSKEILKIPTFKHFGTPTLYKVTQRTIVLLRHSVGNRGGRWTRGHAGAPSNRAVPHVTATVTSREQTPYWFVVSHVCLCSRHVPGTVRRDATDAVSITAPLKTTQPWSNRTTARKSGNFVHTAAGHAVALWSTRQITYRQWRLPQRCVIRHINSVL